VLAPLLGSALDGALHREGTAALTWEPRRAW
jgi:hypothetical protein